MLRATHSQASQWTFALAMAIIAIVGLPALADSTLSVNQPLDAEFAQVIAREFGRTGGSTLRFDNTTIENSAFDFAAYMRSGCFKPTDFDKEKCEQQYGPYGDFKATLVSGVLFKILTEYNLFGRSGQPLYNSIVQQVAPGKVVSASEPDTSSSSSSSVAPVSSSSAPSTTTETTVTTPARGENDLKLQREVIEQRAAIVWKICKIHYAFDTERAICYQRNIRLINLEVPVAENVR